MLVAAILARRVGDSVLLDRHLTYKASDLLTVSPITKATLATGASVPELCAATLQCTNYAAANLPLGSKVGRQQSRVMRAAHPRHKLSVGPQ